MSTLMDHIHISDTLGSAPENSPNHKWKVRWDSRIESPVIHADIDIGLQGDVFVHVTKRSGSVVQRTDYSYVVKVQADGVNTTEELKDILKGLNGKVVYFVDNYHVANNSDHTNYVQQGLLEVGDFRSTVPDLSHYWVPIRITNISTSP